MSDREDRGLYTYFDETETPERRWTDGIVMEDDDETVAQYIELGRAEYYDAWFTYIDENK